MYNDVVVYPKHSLEAVPFCQFNFRKILRRWHKLLRLQHFLSAYLLSVKTILHISQKPVAASFSAGSCACAFLEAETSCEPIAWISTLFRVHSGPFAASVRFCTGNPGPYANLSNDYLQIFRLRNFYSSNNCGNFCNILHILNYHGKWLPH